MAKSDCHRPSDVASPRVSHQIEQTTVLSRPDRQTLRHEFGESSYSSDCERTHRCNGDGIDADRHLDVPIGREFSFRIAICTNTVDEPSHFEWKAEDPSNDSPRCRRLVEHFDDDVGCVVGELRYEGGVLKGSHCTGATSDL